MLRPRQSLRRSAFRSFETNQALTLSMAATKMRIGFIGAGNMAQAIGRRIIEKGLISAKDVFVSAPSERNFQAWADTGVNFTHNNHEVVLQCDLIFLAMKPQYLDEMLTELRIRPHEWTFSKLVVSILAGLSCETLHEKLKPVFLEYRLIRMIPNTSVLIGEGFTAICPDASATEDDIKVTTSIMSAGGAYEIVPESMMSAMSALSGSGVAFVYQIIEALSDGAVEQGLPRAMSYRVAAQTLLGASKMVLNTNEHPAVLKDNVCSPGGTTIRGIHALERGGLRATIMNAIDATVARFNELDTKFKNATEKKNLTSHS